MTQAIYNARAYARQLGAMAHGENAPERYWASFADRASADDFARWLELRGTKRHLYRVKGGFAVDFWDQSSADRERARERAAARALVEKVNAQWRDIGVNPDVSYLKLALFGIALVLAACFLVTYPVPTLLVLILAALVWGFASLLLGA